MVQGVTQLLADDEHAQRAGQHAWQQQPVEVVAEMEVYNAVTYAAWPQRLVEGAAEAEVSDGGRKGARRDGLYILSDGICDRPVSPSSSGSFH